MIYSLKDRLLTTSCLVLSLSISSPGFSMDPPKEEPILSPATRKKSVETTEEDSFFIRTEFGNRKFDAEKWNISLFKSRTEADKVEQLFRVLEEAAFEGDKGALEKLYLFSIKEVLGINRVNEAKAAKALEMGRRRWQAWVVPIYEGKLKRLEKESGELLDLKNRNVKIEDLKLTPGQTEVLNLHRIIANTPLCESSLANKSAQFLGVLFPFDAKTWVESSHAGINKEHIDTLLIRLRKYGCSYYFRHLYAFTEKMKPVNQNMRNFLGKTLQFLLESAALNDFRGLYTLSTYYEKSKQHNKEFIEISSRLAHEWDREDVMFNLAHEYTTGHRTKKDPQKAFEWFAKAADKGIKRAILELVTLLLKNKEEHVTAFKWLQALEPEAIKLATVRDRGNKDIDPAFVFSSLGGFYFNGDIVAKDEQKAIGYFNQAAQLDDKKAILHLAWAYEYGQGVAKNLEEAIKCWTRVSDLSPLENVNRGHCYEARGKELQQQGKTKAAKQHFQAAYKFYESAAQQKDLNGMYLIALHHYSGLGRPQNMGSARDWFKKAANEGHVGAMDALASTYWFKEPKDLQTAELWWKRAIEKNCISSMKSLGWFYHSEYNRSNEGFDLCQKAADLGSEQAQYLCSVLILSKHVFRTDNDEEQALSYLHQSAEKGWAPAMTLLGKYYLERSDDIEKQNLEFASFWLNKAATLGDFDAKTLLQEMESKAEGEATDTIVSPDLKQCLENLKNIEQGIIPVNKELEVNKEQFASPFEEIKKVKSETGSSEDEKELLPAASMQENDQTPQIEASLPEDKLDESFETWKQYATPPKNEDLFKNPKLLRAQLREAGLALKRKQEECKMAQTVHLAPDSSLIIDVLKNKHKREKITYADLYKLFSDPYFKAKGHVELHRTKSGLAISAISFEKMDACSAQGESMTTGTHHNHNKTYKGYNPEFLKNVVKILEMFGV